MIPLTKKKDYWTKEKCLEEGLKYSNKTEWMENSLYSYKLSKKMNWLEEATKHMKLS